MERLTKRYNERVGFSGNGTPIENMCKLPTILRRLAAYEDTGLEPEEVVALANGTLQDATVDIGSDLYNLAISRVFEKTYGKSLQHVCDLLIAEAALEEDT